MTITYKDQGRTKNLYFDEGVWSGDDAQLVAALSVDSQAILPGHSYFPTPWHLVKATADALGGTLDEKEPVYVKGDKKGQVF